MTHLSWSVASFASSSERSVSDGPVFYSPAASASFSWSFLICSFFSSLNTLILSFRVYFSSKKSLVIFVTKKGGFGLE